MARELRYWDSVCFLAVMKDEPKSQLCDGVIQAAEAGDVLIVTSTWTLTEVIRIKGWDSMTEAEDGVIRGFFERDYIALRAVTEEIGHLSRQLAWQQRYSPKDAIHVATALDAKCAVLDTFDRNLIRRGAPKGSDLRITRPDLPYQGDLAFDD
ncbi:MAG: type II toxin-antitoxin system VapC family toxin [Acidimicrobiia bacterium]|nr:type II toxin-antitoxin system VapC family toxin [Acidimicrobiia bacterium]